MDFFARFRFFFLLMCVQSYLSEQPEKETCEIDGIKGECVPLPECTQLLSLLKDSSSTAEGLRASSDRRCGFHGNNAKVCCTVKESKLMKMSESLEDDDNESDLFVDAFPDHETCGKTDVDREHKEEQKLEIYSECIENKSETLSECKKQKVIANGIALVSREMSRFMALLGYKVDSVVLWNCGGSVITEKHILTAAHCIRHNLYVVRVGELDLAYEEKDAEPIDFYIKKMIPHEHYSSYHNDIGILVLDGRINFKEEHHVGPICLPYDSRKKELKKYLHRRPRVGVFIAGWGEAPEMRTRPTWLSYAYINIISNDMCRRQYGSTNRTIDERVFCAGDTAEEHDACNGDSGGPIFAKYAVPDFNQTFFYQLGIISYGYRCSSRRYTGVYTNVTHFLPWIREKVLGTTL